MSNHMKITGGRGGGGGGMMKTFKRVVRSTAGNFRHRKPVLSLPPPPPAVSGNTLRKASVLNVSTSESPFDTLSLPSPVSKTWPLYSAGDSVGFCGEEFDWVSVDSVEGDVLADDAPSVDEVRDALSALQLVLDEDRNPVEEDYGVLQPADAISRRVHSIGSELDWMEPPLQLCNAGVLHLQPYLHDRLFDAFHLFQTEPSIQRVVVSLASDKAVWAAVMNNEVVRELITNECDAERLDESPEVSDSAAEFVKRLFERSKTRIMDVIERITKYITHLFRIPDDGEATSGAPSDVPVVATLQTVLLLSIAVLLIVVVNRATRA